MENYIEYTGEYCGSRIYMKRDDKLPFSYGGNKVRIAAELFKDIEEGGYTAVISYGSPSSNMNRAVADTARLHGIKCYVLIKMDKLGITTENERLAKAAGAELVFCTDGNIRASVEALTARAEAEGFRPYYIYGDSTGSGNELSLMRASYKEYAEILEYERAEGLTFDDLVLTCGTGMTTAGLAAAINDNYSETRPSPRLIGISAARTAENAAKHIRQDLLRYYGGDEDRIRLMPEILDEYLCGGYGSSCPELEAVIRDMELRGIPLDPTYTGKCFWGLLSEIKAGRISGNILFIHTGGYPVYLDWKNNKMLVQSAEGY